MYEDEDNNGKFPHESPVELAVVYDGRRAPCGTLDLVRSLSA